MANEVIKDDGTREPFDAEKIRISIRAAARAAGLAEDKVQELVSEVGESAIDMAEAREVIVASEIRSFILNELDEIDFSVAEAWREYDRTK